MYLGDYEVMLQKASNEDMKFTLMLSTWNIYRNTNLP